MFDACGPRPAGSVSCLLSARLIADDLRASCDRVEQQGFDCHPHAFVGQLIWSAPAALVASALLFFGYYAAAALVFLVVGVVSVLEFGFYFELLDRLFPRRRCSNVVGVIEPAAGPATRQVVLSAHHDSAYEFRYLRVSKLLYAAVAGWFSLAGYGMPFVAGAFAVAEGFFDLTIPVEAARAAALFTGGAAAAFLGFVGFRAVPGAGDNLVSSGALVTLAASLRARLAEDPGALHGTRVIFASFDAEESGLRGSRAFVRDNREWLTALPTVDLNLESLYRLDSLAVMVTDLNGTVRLSERLAGLFVGEAALEGLQVARMRMSYGLGATDSAEFARAGIPATTLLAVPHGAFDGKPVVYHTREDLPERIEPQVVDAALTLVERVVARLADEDGGSAVWRG
jgi:hypothetical protein